MNRLLFNFSSVDITPTEPLFLTGYANRSGRSTAIHRPLVSRCLVLAQGSDKVCLVANDLMEMAPELVDEVVTMITSKTGIAKGNIFIHSVHTHSAPIMDNMGLAHSKANDRYREASCKAIAENAIKTIGDESAFKLAVVKIGKSTALIGANRRFVDPETGQAVICTKGQGLFDPEVVVVQIADPQGKKQVTLFNYACHPVTLGSQNLAVSPDFVGQACTKVEQGWGGHAMFLNGAAGDINPVNGLNTNTRIPDQEGEKLGQSVIDASLAEMQGTIDLKCLQGTIDLPYRDQNITREWIDQEVQRKRSDQTEFVSWKSDLEQWGKDMKELVKASQIPKARSTRVGAVRFGDVVLFFCQGEVFIKYQIELKKAFPQTLVVFVGYTNGEAGYLPTAEEFQHKGYEVDFAYVYVREPSPLTPEVERKFLAEAKHLLGGVF